MLTVQTEYNFWHSPSSVTLLLSDEPEKPLTAKPPSSSTLNWLSTPSTRGQTKSRAPCDGVHRIRVDFKRDHDVEKVWEAGGLSLLTSVPVTPRVLCFLCASSGNVEVNKWLLSWIRYFRFLALFPVILTAFIFLRPTFLCVSFLSVYSLSSARCAVNRSISFAWGNQSALSRSSLRTGVVDDADSARPADASIRKLK